MNELRVFFVRFKGRGMPAPSLTLRVVARELKQAQAAAEGILPDAWRGATVERVSDPGVPVRLATERAR